MQPAEALASSQSSLPSYNEATSGLFSPAQSARPHHSPAQQENMGKKKKIIPVQSGIKH